MIARELSPEGAYRPLVSPLSSLEDEVIAVIFTRMVLVSHVRRPEHGIADENDVTKLRHHH